MAIKTNLTSMEPSRERLKRTIRLISGAYYARDRFPDGAITVFPWSTATDAWMMEQFQHNNRPTILWEVAEKLCDLKGLPVGSITVGDAYTILLVARAVRSKNVLTYTSKCPGCSETATEHIAVPDGLEKVAEKALNYAGYDEITLPESRDVVRLRPLFVKDSVSIAERSPEQKAAIPDVLASTLCCIVSVGGGAPESYSELAEWHAALDPVDVDFIEREQNRLTPRLNQTIPHQCNSCKTRFSHTLRFDQEFFRPSV